MSAYAAKQSKLEAVVPNQLMPVPGSVAQGDTLTASATMLASVGSKMAQLVRKSPKQRLLAAQARAKYEQAFGEPLDYASLGFVKLCGLIAALDEVTMESAGNEAEYIALKSTKNVNDPSLRLRDGVASTERKDDTHGCTICGIAAFVSEAQRAEHAAGKKHAKAARATRMTSSVKQTKGAKGAERDHFSNWIDEPTFTKKSEDVIRTTLSKMRGTSGDRLHHRKCAGVDCRREFCAVGVMDPSYILVKDANWNTFSGRLLALGHKKEAISKVVREIQKGVANKNKEALFDDKFSEKIEEFRALEASPDLIVQLAFRFNVTTTDLGFALAGKKMSRHVCESPEDTHVTFNDCSAEESELRRSWAMVAKDVSSKDYITGLKICSSSGRAECDKRGEEGESELITSLECAGIRPASYQTEDELKVSEFENEVSGNRATPDVVFREHGINIKGRAVMWIDVKKKLLIPGISSDEELKNYDNQINRYTKRFGPGAILWAGDNNTGFTISMIEHGKANEHAVTHFSVGSRNQNPPKKQQAKKLTKAVLPSTDPVKPHGTNHTAFAHGLALGAALSAPFASHGFDASSESRQNEITYGFSGPVHNRPGDPAMSPVAHKDEMGRRGAHGGISLADRYAQHDDGKLLGGRSNTDSSPRAEAARAALQRLSMQKGTAN